MGVSFAHSSGWEVQEHSATSDEAFCLHDSPPGVAQSEPVCKVIAFFLCTNAITGVPSTRLHLILCPSKDNHTPKYPPHENASQLCHIVNIITITNFARREFWESYANHHRSSCFSIPSLSPDMLWHFQRVSEKCLLLLKENRACLPNHKSSVYLQQNSQRAKCLLLQRVATVTTPCSEKQVLLNFLKDTVKLIRWFVWYPHHYIKRNREEMCLCFQTSTSR